MVWVVAMYECFQSVRVSLLWVCAVCWCIEGVGVCRVCVCAVCGCVQGVGVCRVWVCAVHIRTALEMLQEFGSAGLMQPALFIVEFPLYIVQEH